MYGNSWGFLGGFSWSLLCAYICIDYSSRDKSLEALLTHFFQVMSQRDRRQVISLTNAGKQYVAKSPQDLFPIISSIEPCKNTARNVTRSTTRILQAEFDRGAAISAQILTGKSTWKSLYEPIDPAIGMNALLSIAISDPDESECQKCSELLESTLIGLTIKLEQIGIFVRPVPQVELIENTRIFRLYLNLPPNDELDSAAQLGREFISQLNGVGETTKLDLSICSTLL